ncbi:MAG TPA: F0F1 ATP synthase subunit delta, partial [Thermoanaerobaculia bacterium]|nr:F0F1 ATP synthase subunit delta [Thermoanaerobaculia bacterium]
AYQQALKEQRGEIDVAVTSAVPLSPKITARIQDAVARLTGKKPELQLSVDPALLGGLVLRVADRKIDGSVRTRIAGLAERLLERGAEQIVGAAEG